MRLRNIYSVVNRLKIAVFVALIGAFASRAHAAASCTLSSTSPSVTICTPADGATGLTSPVHVNAGTTASGHTVTLVQIYVDGVKATEASGNFIDANVAMATGTHRLTVQAKDNAGTLFKKSITIGVGGTPPPPPPPSGDLSNLKHIFFMAQENRSFDTYLGRLGQYRVNKGQSSNVNGIPLTWVAKTKDGRSVSPFHQQTVCTDNMTPGWNESHYDVDG